MAVVGGILIGLGAIMAIWGWIWLVILAFKDSALWGIIVLFTSWLGSLIFTIVRKPAPGWKPFIYMIGGGVICIIGSVIMAAGAKTVTTPEASMIISTIINHLV